MFGSKDSFFRFCAICFFTFFSPFNCKVFFLKTSLASRIEVSPLVASASAITNAKANISVTTASTASTSGFTPLKINLAVTKYKLENGLTVLLYENHSLPMVTYHTWYKVGSREETKGLTGLAHMLEHMMFKGAKKYSGNMFDQVLYNNGIVNNAFTSYDYTGFYEDLPSDQLELIMDLEVDRMTSLALKEEDLIKERSVVAEERRWRIDNNPIERLKVSLLEKIFKNQAYEWPVIGLMSDIEKYEAQSLRSFFDKYYGPNNAVLVIAGDIHIEKTKKWIQKYYGPLKEKPVPIFANKNSEENSLKNTSYLDSLDSLHTRDSPDSRDSLKSKMDSNELAEPSLKEQTQKKNHADHRIILETEVQSSTLLFAFKGASIKNEDSYPLKILASTLGEGTSSRLYKRLVFEKSLATSVFVSNSSLKDPGLFLIEVNLKPETELNTEEMASTNKSTKTPEKTNDHLKGENEKIAINKKIQEVEKIILEELTKIKTGKLSAKEVEKAKNLVLKEFVDSLSSLAEKAQSLAVNEILFNDYKYLFTHLEKYEAVTSDSIQKAAQKYLKSENQYIGILKPKNSLQNSFSEESKSKKVSL